MLLVSCALLGLLCGGLLTALTPRTYEAKAKSFVSFTAVNQADAPASILSGAQFILQRGKSYTDLADSVTLLQPVISQLDLKESVTQLAGDVTVTNPADTVILEVGARDGNPQRAANIANAVANQLSQVIEQIEPSVDGKPLVAVTVTKRAVPNG